MTASWREAVERAGVDVKVVSLLEEVDRIHGLHECARGGAGEIGLGAAQDAYAAVYVSRNGMTIALEPEDAGALSASQDLFLITKTPRTHYVRVPHHRLSDTDTASKIAAALDRAVQRSWLGPRWQRGGAAGAPARLTPTCPIHHYSLSVSGECMGCDGKPPEM